MHGPMNIKFKIKNSEYTFRLKFTVKQVPESSILLSEHAECLVS